MVTYLVESKVLICMLVVSRLYPEIYPIFKSSVLFITQEDCNTSSFAEIFG